MNIASPAVMVYNTNADNSLLYNNIFVGIPPAKGSYEYIKYNYQPNNHWVENYNLKTTTISAAGFVNASAGDFHLAAGSAAINTGTNVAAYGVIFDRTGA